MEVLILFGENINLQKLGIYPMVRFIEYLNILYLRICSKSFKDHEIILDISWFFFFAKKKTEAQDLNNALGHIARKWQHPDLHLCILAFAGTPFTHCAKLPLTGPLESWNSHLDCNSKFIFVSLLPPSVRNYMLHRGKNDCVIQAFMKVFGGEI